MQPKYFFIKKIEWTVEQLNSRKDCWILIYNKYHVIYYLWKIGLFFCSTVGDLFPNI